MTVASVPDTQEDSTPRAPAPGDEAHEAPPRREDIRCLRCRQVVPVDEDGFCESCLKEIDQACL